MKTDCINLSCYFFENFGRWLTCLLLCVALPMAAGSTVVRVEQAGTLETHIAAARKYHLTDLTVYGPLNGSDLRFLREMAGRSSTGAPTKGRLAHLNLEHADLVAGGLPYYFHFQSKADTLGAAAFLRCSLKTLRLPSTLKYVAQDALEYCEALSEVTIPEGNAYYSSLSGMLCNAQGNVLRFCPQGRKGSVVVPEGIQTIGKLAFEGCSKITALTFPASLTTVGERAFKGCDGLTKLTFPEGLKVLERRSCFGCHGLQEVDLPTSLEEMKDGVFAACTRLRKVNIADGNQRYASREGVVYDAQMSRLLYCPEGYKGELRLPTTVRRWSPNALGEMWALKKIVLPPNMAKLPDNALMYCYVLEAIDVLPGNAAYAAQDGVLYDAALQTLLYCPAFKSGTLHIPSTVTTIAPEACWGCYRLDKVRFAEDSALSAVGYCAFWGCDGLRHLHLPNGLKTIGKAAFWGCRGLKSVTFPASLTSLGSKAFRGCLSLTTVQLPAALPAPERAFDGCRALSRLEVAPENPYLSAREGLLYNKAGNVLLRCPEGRTGKLVVPSMITDIGAFAFAGCERLKEIQLSEGLQSIGQRAFWGCRRLKQIDLPDGLSSMGAQVFADCPNLSAVVVSRHNRCYEVRHGFLYDKRQQVNTEEWPAVYRY